MAAFGIFLDIVTDLLLVGVPIQLLWSVRIKPRQKFIVGVFLCLNLCMVIVAAIRVSGLDFRGKFDTVWLFVWSQIESCVAVSMISLTAFRSAFVYSESSRARREGAKRPWYSSSIEAIRRKRAQRLSDEEATQGLPTIPSATLSGMRTFIHGGRHYRSHHQITDLTATFDEEFDERPLHRGSAEPNRAAGSPIYYSRTWNVEMKHGPDSPSADCVYNEKIVHVSDRIDF